MRESYGEGVAGHTGPESCVGARKGSGEALIGAHAGRVWSRAILFKFGVPTPWDKAEGNTVRIAIARDAWTPRGRRPRACMETLRAGIGRSRSCLLVEGPGGRMGKSKDAIP
jgi:hypothetical protein